MLSPSGARIILRKPPQFSLRALFGIMTGVALFASISSVLDRDRTIVFSIYALICGATIAATVLVASNQQRTAELAKAFHRPRGLLGS